MKKIKFLFLVLGLIFALSSVGFAQAQTVSLASLDGGSVSLQSQKGKVVVLAVGATWLPLSKQQALIINKLTKKYAGRDVMIYFVATDSTSAKSKNFASAEQIRAFAAKNRIGVSVLRDSDGLITLKKFQIDQLPSFVLIDKDGKIATEPFGGMTTDAESENDFTVQISRRIDKLL